MKAFKTPIVGAALAVAMIAATAGSAQAGDPEAGKKVFKQCSTCHWLKPGKAKVGPSLHGVIGRKAGTEKKFKKRYSKTMKSLDLTWTKENIGKYLLDPDGFAPGNRMTKQGQVKNQKDIDDVLAYIEQESK